MITTISALIAACAALVAVYCTQFLAESFRRLKDGSALAAGLAGELESYKDAVPLIRISLRTAKENVEIGRKDQLKFRGFEKPTDRFFEEVVGKLGSLGPDLAGRILYVYGNLNGFRSAFVLIHEKHQDMDGPELLARIALCGEALERAADKGEKLIADLKARAAAEFRPFDVVMGRTGN